MAVDSNGYSSLEDMIRKNLLQLEHLEALELSDEKIQEQYVDEAETFGFPWRTVKEFRSTLIRNAIKSAKTIKTYINKGE